MRKLKVNNEVTTVPTIEQPGTPKGRQVGTKNKHSINAVRRLAQLNFDPLAKMVDAYNELCREIDEINSLKLVVEVKEGGTAQRRYSSMAHAQLLALKQKLISDLLRYGYARVPEGATTPERELPGITINLTPRSPSIKPKQEITDVG